MSEIIASRKMNLYFPDGSNQSLVDKDVALKLTTLNHLIQSIKNDGYFHFDEKGEDFQSRRETLAFLVEANYQLYPDEWESEIETIVAKIHTIRDNASDLEDAKKEISWLLNKIIVNLYEKSLVTNSLFASKQKDPGREKYFNKVFEQHQMLSSWERESEQRNEAVSLRKIRPEMIPHWIKKDGGPEYTKKIQDQHDSFSNQLGRVKER